ncbi:hypothetical protein DFP73DRAFT_398042 [Morchella snyderi]|nr:hypothetical protein DFP73DRAFT_398042 [Morchella snyderi]
MAAGCCLFSPRPAIMRGAANGSHARCGDESAEYCRPRGLSTPRYLLCLLSSTYIVCSLYSAPHALSAYITLLWRCRRRKAALRRTGVTTRHSPRQAGGRLGSGRASRRKWAAAGSAVSGSLCRYVHSRNVHTCAQGGVATMRGRMDECSHGGHATANLGACLDPLDERVGECLASVFSGLFTMHVCYPTAALCGGGGCFVCM